MEATFMGDEDWQIDLTTVDPFTFIDKQPNKTSATPGISANLYPTLLPASQNL
jgi:hypothetical protein